ncbi:MAG: SNF2 helicase associated domain-containing protein [Cyanobacteria bacterium HKST-UBA04]|nr:SNF2 helicase associated domain-containing protein [Cyanobacteria bacterium HKST-UBA04]
MAKPGSWRRGYGYYRAKGQVSKIELIDVGIQAKVKGNYKAHYTTKLIIDDDGFVSVDCDCPLDEEWCKHAVAVGLKAIDEDVIPRYFGEHGYEPDKLAPLKKVDPDAFEGRFRFLMSWEEKPKTISFQVFDRRERKQLKRLDGVLKEAIQLQKQGELELTPAEKREYKFLKLLFQHKQHDAGDGWFHIGGEPRTQLLDELTGLEELGHHKDNTRIYFAYTPLRLVLSVNASMAGNVLVSFHWHVDEPYPDVFPLEEVQLLGRALPWGYYKNTLFPLAHTLRYLPTYLTRSTFYDVRDAEGGKFVFEELPKIRHHVEVEQAEVIEKAFLEQEPPKKRLIVRRPEKHVVRAELEFDYEGTKVEYSKGHEAPYVTVTNKKTETIYWLKRDKKVEDKSYVYLQNLGLEPMQTNHLEAQGDAAIDFISYGCPKLLKHKWFLDITDEIQDLTAADYPLKIRGNLDFSSESVDEFTLTVACGIGTDSVEIDRVQDAFVSGRKYIHLENHGWAEIPLKEILQFNQTLNAFDKVNVGQDTYKIKTFQAGLISELQDQGVELQMSERFQAFWDLISAFRELEQLPIPENVNADLRPYQKHGFNWLWFLYTYGLNGILADDMGLGKTLQTLVAIQHAKNVDGSQPNLIVCPTSVVYNWINEARKFTPELKVLNLTGSERHHSIKKIGDYDLVVTSYALLRRDIKILRQFQLRFAVLDESQHIKNLQSQTAQAAKQLKAHHRLALSGTPLENRLSELWSAFDFLMPGFLLDLDEFRYRFITPIEEKNSIDAERRLRKQIAPFILRRLKRDVAKDLPDKIENIMYCDLTDEQQDLYLDVLERTREEVFGKVNADGKPMSQASMLSSLLRLRQVCCHPKLLKDFIEHKGVESGKFNALKDMLEDIIDEGHRVLLFSQFVEMLDIVKKWLEVEGIPFCYLTGQTKDREAVVNKFNNTDSIPIFLISLKAGGTGLNLTGADYVIHYDPWWNPAVEEQATDRAHRIGQTKKVFVYRLITRGTVEEKIVALQHEKRSLVDSVISVDRGLSKSLSFDDLKDILTPGF